MLGRWVCTNRFMRIASHLTRVFLKMSLVTPLFISTLVLTFALLFSLYWQIILPIFDSESLRGYIIRDVEEVDTRANDGISANITEAIRKGFAVDDKALFRKAMLEADSVSTRSDEKCKCVYVYAEITLSTFLISSDTARFMFEIKDNSIRFQSAFISRVMI